MLLYRSIIYSPTQWSLNTADEAPKEMKAENEGLEHKVMKMSYSCLEELCTILVLKNRVFRYERLKWMFATEYKKSSSAAQCNITQIWIFDIMWYKLERGNSTVKEFPTWYKYRVYNLRIHEHNCLLTNERWFTCVKKE